MPAQRGEISGPAAPKGTAVTLGPQEIAILRTEFCSIIAASSGPDRRPSVSRALGRRFSADLCRVTLFFAESDARELLDHVAATGKIAAVFSIPRTHRSLQLKGIDAEVESSAPDDLLLVNSYRLAFTEHLHQLGHAPQLIQALMECGPDDLTAVSFTPSAAFSQTPGPHAGQAVGAAT